MKTNKWEQKKLLLEQLVREEGLKKAYTIREASRKDCKWCEKFKIVDYRYCLSCGSPVKDE